MRVPIFLSRLRKLLKLLYHSTLISFANQVRPHFTLLANFYQCGELICWLVEPHICITTLFRLILTSVVSWCYSPRWYIEPHICITTLFRLILTSVVSWCYSPRWYIEPHICITTLFRLIWVGSPPVWDSLMRSKDQHTHTHTQVAPL